MLVPNFPSALRHAPGIAFFCSGFAGLLFLALLTWPCPAHAQGGLSLPGPGFIQKKLRQLSPGKSRNSSDESGPMFEESAPPPLPSRNRRRGPEHRLQALKSSESELRQREQELSRRTEEYNRLRKQLQTERRELRRIRREVRQRKRTLRRMQRRVGRDERSSRTIKTPVQNTSSEPAKPATVQNLAKKPDRLPSDTVAPWPRTPRTEPVKQKEALLRNALIDDNAVAEPDNGPPPLPTRRPRRKLSQIKVAAWTPDLIQKAKDECVSLLANVEIKALPLPAMQKGRCGAPAPVMLTHISQTNPIEIKPSATLSCPMVAGLAKWLVEDVQPLARKLLGTQVKRLRNVSSYVCRRRYGAANTRISEHAYANALDIAAFDLENGERVTVLGDWGPVKLAEENAKNGAASQASAAEPEDSKPTGKSAFLHALHESACKRFGTVLGPNANHAHRDHFHLDMKPRRRSNYCR